MQDYKTARPVLGGLLRLAAGATLLALPVLAQYNSNDITPPSSGSGKLNGASSGKQVGGGGNGHALLLNGNALTSVDLHPVGYSSSMATSTDDVQQCGYGYNPVQFGNTAILWSGSAASAAGLNPSGYNWSYCLGVHGGQQVGYGEKAVYFVTTQHAMLWYGSAGSAIDLHPIQFTYSKGTHVRNGEQVGYGSNMAYPYGDTSGYQTGSHALKWNGSAASAVDLHPVGYDSSQAWATNGTQQGGWGYIATSPTPVHALLWNGSAASVVDLHPAGYTTSKIFGMTATQQVGEGWVGTPGGVGSVRHALVWSGSAGSVVDLNQYLPAGYTHAVATGIDANGNVVGYAHNSASAGAGVPADAIAVVFARGPAPAGTVASLALTPANPAPGAAVQGVVSLSGAAPASGATLSFFSTNASLIPAPGQVVVPAGQSSASFTFVAGGVGLTVPATAKLYVSDGVYSRSASLKVTPVVNLTTLSVNTVEGGFQTVGTVSLNIPAQTGGAAITLASGNTALATVPASVTIGQGGLSASFTVTTNAVTASTVVPITATLNGQSVTGNLTLSPAPVVSLSALSFPAVIGGQSVTGTVTVNNYPRTAPGAVVSLVSTDAATLQVPATVTIPVGVYSVNFTATTSTVTGAKGVTVRATYNGSTVSTTVSVNPTPTVSITSADYLTDTKLFKVQASTSFANSVLTYGVDGGPAIGTFQFEQGVWKAATVLATAPSTVTVWNSNGGQATAPVRLKTSLGGGGGGGGGGGTAATFKLTVNRNGKGSVVSSPSGIGCGLTSGGCSASFNTGTAVTLTATPDPGSIWAGWGGACSGTAATCTVTLSADTSVTANFR